jgi:Ca-activated chloride channel family protein
MPILTNVEISGSALLRHAPERIPDVFEGAPLVAAVAVSAEGGELVVRGQLAREAWEQTIRVAAQEPGTGNQAIRALYGRERVADVEANALFSSVDGEVEELGVTFQIATRMTSWVAIDEASQVTGPSRDQLIPQELPYGTSASAFGLRGSVPQMQQVSTRAGVLKGNATLEMLIGAVPRSMSFDTDALSEGSFAPPGAPAESDESDDYEAVPASMDFAERFDAAVSPPRYSGGYAEEKAASLDEESFDDGSFEREEPTGLRARRSTAVGAAPPPAAARPSVADVKMRAKAEAPAPAKKEAVAQSSVPEPGVPRSMQVESMNQMGQLPPKQMPTPQPIQPDLLPTRTKSPIGTVLWVLALLAVIALLLWWLLA